MFGVCPLSTVHITGAKPVCDKSETKHKIMTNDLF